MLFFLMLLRILHVDCFFNETGAATTFFLKKKIGISKLSDTVSFKINSINLLVK